MVIYRVSTGTEKTAMNWGSKTGKKTEQYQAKQFYQDQ
jgi:hypothetical protein